MLKSLSPRRVFIALVLLAVTSMLFAMVFLERMLELYPCPLCMTQRIFIVLGGVIALIAALHNPSGWGRRLYGLACVAAAATGGAVAGRHIWLQNLPEGQAPACGPGLEYMFETLPLSEAVSTLMMGDGNCADVVWTFMGLSIPEQTLLVFIVIGAISLWQTVRHYPAD
jgi:protein dithiol:quinone oxidoreductase